MGSEGGGDLSMLKGVRAVVPGNNSNMPKAKENTQSARTL